MRLPKTVTKLGGWKVTTGAAKMPPSAFALTKRASYRLGRNWHWRVDELEGSGFHFRLLTAFRSDTLEFTSMLAVAVGDGLRVLARLEFHGSHPGWHCHTACELDHEELPVGESNPRSFARAPSADHQHRRQSFVKTETEAQEKAFKFFGVKPGKDWTLAG